MAKRNQPPVNHDRPRNRSRTEPSLLSRWPSPILNQHLNRLEDIAGVPTQAAAAAPTSPPPQESPTPPVPSPAPDYKEQIDQMSRKMDIFANIFSEMRKTQNSQEQKIRELTEQVAAPAPSLAPDTRRHDNVNEDICELYKMIINIGNSIGQLVSWKEKTTANEERIKTIAGAVTNLAGAVLDLREAQAGAGHPPPPPPPPPPHPLPPPLQTTPPPETPDREVVELVMKKVREEDDKYYCNTINIKGFSPEAWSHCMERLTTLTPRKLATEMLMCDLTENIVYDAVQIKFMNEKRSLRLTYQKNITLRKNLKWVGTMSHELEVAGSKLSLSYFQMTPKRFTTQRNEIYALLSRDKKQKRIKNFSFLICRGRLCCMVGSRLVTLHRGRIQDLHKIEEEERRSQNEDEVTGPRAARQEENIDQQVAATDDDRDIWDLAGANLTPMFGPED